MPSPFPGMNPYLEQADVWSDFHHSLITEIRNELTAQLGQRFVVKIEERLYVVAEGDEEGVFFGRSDVSVAQPGKSGSSSTGVMEAPAHVVLPIADVERWGYIEIRDNRNRRLITVIEVLSPSNKNAGGDRRQYLYKRNEILFSGASLVEVDLLRGGQRMPMQEMPPCDYCILVSRNKDRPRADFWPIALRRPLPRVSIPLASESDEATLELQTLVHRVYDEAQYAGYIYDSPPEPPLSGEDAAWAEGILKQHGA